MPLDNIYHRVTFGVIIGLHLAFVLHRWMKKKIVFQANVTRIKRLWIYPIKALPGIPVDRVVMNPSGLEYSWSPSSSSSSKMVLKDREYVLLNADSRMITQRQEPRLSLIKVSLNEKEGSLTLSAPGMNEALVINTTSRGTEEVIKFNIWSTPTEGIVVSEKANKWFSSFLKQKGVRLFKHRSDLKKRPTSVVSRNRKTVSYQNLIRYQDGSPILVINTTTLNELNTLLPPSLTPFSEINFRPNIVIEHPASKKEEEFLYLRFPCDDNTTIIAQNVKLCERCSVPTVNPSTGEKESERAEIMTKFRTAKTPIEKKIYAENSLFGINICPNREGTVVVGSWIDVAFEE